MKNQNIKTWNTLNLDEIVTLIDGDRSSNYPSKSDLVKEGILFINTSNIKNHRFILKEVDFITEDRFNRITKGKLIKDDIVITLRGSIGNIAIFEAEKYETGFINAQMAILRTKKNCYPSFLHQNLSSSHTQQMLKTAATGSAQLQLPLKDLKNLKILIPPLPEQKKIAKILSTVDNHIDEIDGMIEDLKELKKGLMQKLLTEGIGHTEFKGSPVGRIPVEWEVKTVGEISSLITKGTTPSTVGFGFVDAGINYIRGENIGQYGNLIGEYLKITKECNEKLSRSIIQENDILVSIVGYVGKSAIVNSDVAPANTNQNIAIVRIENTLYDSDFIKRLFESRYLQEYVRKNLTVGAQPSLSLKQVSDFKIPLPSYVEQVKISNILFQLDKIIGNEDYRLEEMKKLKKGLMQQLLTGKTRVKIN